MLNTIVQPEEAPFYGIPFPGFFLLNEDGVIVDKLFNRHLAHREGLRPSSIATPAGYCRGQRPTHDRIRG